MIGCFPIRLAATRPAAGATVTAWLPGRNLWWSVRECLQSPLRDRVVVNKVGYPQRHPVIVSQLHVHFGRRAALLSPDQSGIARELDHMLGFGPSGQLGVERFVAPGTEVRCFLDPLQEVGIAVPGKHYQSRLIGQRGPGLHHLPSVCGSLGEVEPFAGNLNDVESPRFDRGEVALFVLDTLLENQPGRSVARGDLHRIG